MSRSTRVPRNAQSEEQLLQPRLGRTVFSVMALVALSSLGGGCAELIGLEQREEPDGVLDEETERATTQQCVEYCDMVMDACENENSVYTTRFTCIDACNHLEPGIASEPAGNTVACRAKQAEFAQNGSPAEFCPSAGPSGGEACGEACPAWCELLSSACPDDFEALDDCESACSSLTDAGPFNVNDYYTGDTVQCRLIHVCAAFDDDSHCAHAAFAATDKCLDEGTDKDPTCEVYCRNVMGACTGDNAQYESTEQCLNVCSSFDAGELSDTNGGNTVGCRQYHANAALAAPDPHCPHSGPTGGALCEDENEPGACEPYCQILAQVCPDQDQDDCLSECNRVFAESGADGRMKYNVREADSEDDLSCRFLQLSRAAAGDEDACALAGIDATCL